MCVTSRWAVGATRALAAALLVTALPAAGSAQYFGANKVQYRALHFRVLKTEHFDIYFQHEERESVDIAARLAERWATRLSRFFGHQLGWRQQLVLYRSQVDFEQTPIVQETLDLGTRGLTEPWRRRIVMPLVASLAERDHIIGHELVHAFQFDLLSRQPPAGEERIGARLPRWFLEGLAEYLALGGINSHTAMWLRDAARAGDLPSLHALQHPRFFAYPWGHAFWAYLGGRWSEEEVAAVFTTASFAGVPTAIERVLGLTSDQFVAEWQTAIRVAYLTRTGGVGPVGWPVLAADALGRHSNTGPAMSPDGQWLAFLSEGPSSVDLFIADVASGRVVARLTDTSANPDDPNAQFVDSAGAWDREGRRLAVGMVAKGRAAISVFAWPGGARQLELAFDDVDEVFSPTWSPDGRSLAFTGTSGGVADLFVYDLERASLRRLTHDSFADVQPTWDPNGRRIAFVTDRFTTDTGTLTFGAYRLALIDTDTGVIEAVPPFSAGKHICPQWSPDGSALYAIADGDGTSNLYRIDLASGVVKRLTAVITGLSGVTASSPALSVAGRADIVAFSVYERGRFTIHTWMPTSGKPVETASLPTELESDPVNAHYADEPIGWLADAISDRERWPVSSYKPRLSLERLSQPAFSVGVDRLRAATGTGLGVVLTDLLNTHWVVTALELNHVPEPGRGLKGTGAFAGYVNRVHRWNWGAVASYVPSVTGARVREDLSPGAVSSPPRVALIRQTELSATALAAYAFDRARRVEFTAGVSHLGFDRAAGFDGDVVTLATASAAFVSDKTDPGATSILRGKRLRLELAPTFGTIRYINVLADYRRYFTPLPFYTVAARAIHVGRYGGGDDRPILPLYLGSPTLVRGYGLGSRSVSECVGLVSERCNEVARLFGNRTVVGNVELRFPLLRPFGISRWMYYPVPIEVAFFADGGLVWPHAPGSSKEDASPAWSSGVSIRTNVFGLGLGQLDIARPFRNRGGWVVQFNLVPAL